MRLLTKTQIQQEKSKERQLDIDQGLAFARKVDSLRETQENERISLDKFRKDSVDALHTQISALSLERDSLAEEVKTLEEKKRFALKPILEERKELDEKKDELTELEKSLSEAFIKSEQNKQFLFERSQEIDRNTRKSKADMGSAAFFLSEAVEKQEEAKKLLEDAVSQSNELLSRSKTKMTDAQKKEESILLREKNVKNLEEYNHERELALNEKDKLVNDRYQTLLRTESRLKRNG